MLNEPRRLEISARSNVIEQLGKRGIFCRTWSLATHRIGEPIEREDESLSTAEKQIV